MTTQLLTSELANLIQESKRKNNDLRQAAEKSLEELKGIRGGSEAQVATELAQRINFINPFVIACGAKNAKFTGIAIVCLLRLIVISALPRSKLNSVLEALREATSAGVDAQLKILQALPTLLQNYASDIKGDLLITALNICFILQSSKNAIINNTSAATLQQLVVSVFDKVATEDKSPSEGNYIGDAPTQDGAVNLRVAALDAHRIFNDICLMTESQRPEYLRSSSLPQTFGLELIESVLTSHAAVFSSHPEQAHILRTRVIPFIVETLSGKPKFATSVRLVRILYTLLKRHLNVLSSRGAEAFDILTQLLDQDTAVWKRALCIEVFRGIFSEPALIRRIFSLYDATEGQKKVLQNITATFVRVSTEKPATIGLSHHSTIPAANQYSNSGSSTDQAILESTGVTGIISGAVSEGQNTGISSQWSLVRVPCIDQLDKTEAPPIPDSYVYALTLSCMTSLSEGLAKFILPLTVMSDSRSRKRNIKQPQEGGRSSPAPIDEPPKNSIERVATLERANSFRRNPVPVNPLTLKDHPLHAEVQICADIVDECWPAILATCSTFLYAALDSELYHGLVRAFQKFAHVAGLLQLFTPRDAFLTTLGKAAVPPNVLTASLSTGSKVASSTPTVETPNSLLGNARGLLSVESLVSTGGAVGEKQRQASSDATATTQTLNTRNLLCLRALLNLGIALGPTLSSSWRIILETLQQADLVLFATGKSPGKISIAVAKNPDPRAENEANSLLSNFAGEIRAVETAASRLFESTVDFPNDAFVEVITAVCNLITNESEPVSEPASRPHSPTTSTPNTLRTPSGQHRRVFSTSSPYSQGPTQEDQFALAKLGDIANINIDRLLAYPPDESGWDVLVKELIGTLSAGLLSAPIRVRSADILVRLVLDSARASSAIHDDERGAVQYRLLAALRSSILPLRRNDRQLSVADLATDIDIHKILLEGLKSLLEDCGENLLSGWEIAFDVIGSIFIEVKNPNDGLRSADRQPLKLRTRSSKLIRSSFNSLQLICSDFLTSLPNSCFLILVDTLYKFCSQDDDLNIALTTVTFFWVLSDFLSGKSSALPITDDLVGGSDDILVTKASHPDPELANAALLMLLLMRLTTVASDERLELRNSAIQTLLRIFDAYGEKLSSEAWSVCIQSVVFRLFSSIESELEILHQPDADGRDQEQWHDTAVVVLTGVSGLLASYLDVLTEHSTFNSYWQRLLGHFATLLDYKVLDVSTATFKALSQILSRSPDGIEENFNKETVSLAWDLWSRGIPVAHEIDETKSKDNQGCLLAYVAALRDVYRLIQADLSVERVQRMLALLREVMHIAVPGAYVVDIDYTTQLQGQVLEVLKLIRTDIPGSPAALLSQSAKFVSLPFEERSGRLTEADSKKRTYVAMSKASMEILQDLVTTHAQEEELYTSGAFLEALTALSKPITLKYQFPIVSKTTPLWQQATTSSLAVLGATLPLLRAREIEKPVIQQIWQEVVTIANGIAYADCSNIADDKVAGLLEDQEFDIAAFMKLRDLIIPSLGSDAVSDTTRKVYAESLFRMSIIHAPVPAEAAIIYDNQGVDALGLADLYKPRRGRTVDPAPTTRERMSYTSLDELFSLVANHDDATTPSIAVQPPTPSFPPPASAPSSANPPSEAPHALCVRLARTAAPYLILRAALTLRAYIADQPLRGRMPQPLSQRKELCRIVERLVELRSEPDAIPDAPNVDSESRKHLLRLYPLLVGATKVAGGSGDEGLLLLLGRALDVVGVEFGV